MEEIREIEKSSFVVMGKEGFGKGDHSLEWIAPLWKEANDHFSEIASLCQLDEEGNLAGIWGAMTDLDKTDHPWRNGEGRYLAGAEVRPEAKTPKGWNRWVIPGYRYAVLHCTMRSYAEAMARGMKEYMPRHGYLLVGPIQEFYPPGCPAGELELYFPFEKLPIPAR